LSDGRYFEIAPQLRATTRELHTTMPLPQIANLILFGFRAVFSSLFVEVENEGKQFFRVIRSQHVRLSAIDSHVAIIPVLRVPRES
jgi:hypothetical protein